VGAPIRFQPLLFQPVPSLPRFAFSEVLEEVRATFFPEIEQEVELRIAAETALASIRTHFMGRDRHLVVVHPALNHTGTPYEVVRFILKHELIHVVRRPRTVDGWYEPHPPEFWELEFEIAPERYAAWAWLHANLGRCMRHGTYGICVTLRWRTLRETARTPYTPSLPFNPERFEQLCPAGGAQLQLPPEWAARPLPIANCRLAIEA
jgi:hypothetical protein